MAKMKLIPFEEVLDSHYGPIGTPERDKFEAEAEAAVRAYELGELIKKTRLEQHLTQEQLGERIGVKKAQISRIEKGANITLPTMTRVFRALGVPTASIDFGSVGKLALW